MAAGVWAVVSAAGQASFLPPVLLLVAGVLLLWRQPGWWRDLSYGALAGLLAGVVVLAPGFRIAMRIVAMAEPMQRPSFSVEGTLFILLFVGCVIGPAAGAIAATVVATWRVRAGWAWVIAALLVMTTLFLVPDLREELLTLGAGSWVNVPMFAIVSAGYGWLATRAIARMQARRSSRLATRAAEVTSG